ncbi:hydrogenase assembly protein HupF [Actinomadura sp. CNU-125]|uniref:HypC/HybG/HupF family hydrogenase formation chaperone n=1 Tax=Actinomadura sp. CNU-125 TaxID=1904961 RepID=UPI0009591124|nr:HypC/HybG/HupF family hydrogenase formation chaperone [Actinomadura sp. CNU-125]OLT17020.1 hydrogenase assembly protein HupF [Actinomadura sp. CNU-125]
MSAGDVPECHDDVCVTCSDAAVPVRVRELLGDGLALVDTGAGQEEVSVALVDARVGDVVLVHAKEAIAVERSEGTPGGTPYGGTP